MSDSQSVFVMIGALAAGILGLCWMIKKVKESQVPMKVKEHGDSVEITLFI